MPYERINPEKVSQAVIRQIEGLILRGILPPGSPLPSERELSERLGVSRPSLRDAIQEMQDDGLLTRTHGSGVFVNENLNAIFPDPLVKLLSNHQQAAFDYITFRRDIEGIAAERAAQFASDTDLKVIDNIHQQMRTAHRGKSGTQFESKLDADFHMAIVEASHNVIMLHVIRSMYTFMREELQQTRHQIFHKAALQAELLEQHSAINTALQKRNPKRAREAVHAHLDFVEQAMRGIVIASENEAIAAKKYQYQTAHNTKTPEQ